MKPIEAEDLQTSTRLCLATSLVVVVRVSLSFLFRFFFFFYFSPTDIAIRPKFELDSNNVR